MSLESCVNAIPTPPEAECIRTKSFFETDVFSKAKKAVQYWVANANAWPFDKLSWISITPLLDEIAYSAYPPNRVNPKTLLPNKLLFRGLFTFSTIPTTSFPILEW